MERIRQQPNRFLFVLWDGGGNIHPTLALARRVTGRGPRVRVLAPRVLRARIEAAGCAFMPLREVPAHDSSSPSTDLLKDWEARTSLGAAARVRDRLIFGTALAYSRDVAAAIETERPDVVVTDYLLLGAYVAAERAEIPLAALVHTIYPLPAPGLPPFSMGLQPAKGALGRARDVVFASVFRRFYDAGLGSLNQVRESVGLSPLAAVFEQFARADRLLVLTSPAFDFPAQTLPPNVRYVGPQLDDPAWLAPWTPPAELTANHQPLVVVGLSTTYQGQGNLLRRVVTALSELPVRGLITLGPALQGDTLTLPPNVRAESYAPHVLVVPQADLVVTHGGHGTVITALSYGVPVVCLPMGRDQADNAARVVWREAGARCSSTAGVKTLRRAIAHALAEPQFRMGARRIADEIARQGGSQVAIAELEGLAASPVQAAGGSVTI
jgi:MGT family glycosyltransferase